jgi:hypothetical protein
MQPPSAMPDDFYNGGARLRAENRDPDCRD